MQIAFDIWESKTQIFIRQDEQKYLEEIETVAESDEVVSIWFYESDAAQNSYPGLSRETQRKKAKEKEKEHLFQEVMCSTQTQSQYKELHEPG